MFLLQQHSYSAGNNVDTRELTPFQEADDERRFARVKLMLDG